MLYEMQIACDIGDCESGMLVKTYNDYFLCNEQSFERVETAYKSYMYGIDTGYDIVGIQCLRVVPEREAAEILRDMCLNDTPYPYPYD